MTGQVRSVTLRHSENLSNGKRTYTVVKLLNISAINMGDVLTHDQMLVMVRSASPDVTVIEGKNR